MRIVSDDALREAATALISDTRFYGEAYYLRKTLRKHGIFLSPAALRKRMQKLADEGHFVRSKYPHGGQGYTWSIPDGR